MKGAVILQEAREVYGDDKQMAVAMEELAELAAVLSKYFRYDNKDKAIEELHDKVISEVADVYIILEHVKAIFELKPRDIEQMQFLKLTRLSRWLEFSDSPEQTLVDRGLHE